MSATAPVVSVKRCAIHDGPGVRTTVFFRGCGLSCAWCHNPESQEMQARVWHRPDRCMKCNACTQICPQDAVRLGRVDPSRCDGCARCVAICPSEALQRVSTDQTVDEIVAQCAADLPFMLASGGGVTLSGGEPVLHAPFLRALLPRLGALGLHVLLQTAGHYPARLLDGLLEHVDEVFFDWKVPDEHAALAFTGAGLRRVRDSLAHIHSSGVPLTVRMVAIEGVNSSPAALDSVAAELRALGIDGLMLLRHHGLAGEKYTRLGRPVPSFSGPPDLDRVAHRLRHRGIHATVAEGGWG
jgi:pyruvate formate lyase activating enzyme